VAGDTGLVAVAGDTGLAGLAAVAGLAGLSVEGAPAVLGVLVGVLLGEAVAASTTLSDSLGESDGTDVADASCSCIALALVIAPVVSRPTPRADAAPTALHRLMSMVSPFPRPQPLLVNDTTLSIGDETCSSSR
jgi:hypothetical protein